LLFLLVKIALVHYTNYNAADRQTRRDSEIKFKIVSDKKVRDPVVELFRRGQRFLQTERPPLSPQSDQVKATYWPKYQVQKETINE
jgi:hypothetical protein